MKKIKLHFRTLLLVLSLLFLSSCAALQPRFETPHVSLTSFRLLPSESMAPRFEIGLHIINPNLMQLPLKGISYSVKLEGHQLLSGVTSNLPTIQGYSEADVRLEASADLFSGLQLLSELLAQPRETFHYELAAKLDIGSLLPSIPIMETGEIMLQQPRSR
jgi:LEA14-like dessication related protein